MILRSLWLRPTLARPARALVTVLGVAIGVASVESTLLASRAAIASIEGDVEAIAGKAELEVSRPGGVALEDLAALRPLCDQALLVPVVEGSALSEELGDLVRILGVDLLLDGEVRQVELDAQGGDLEAARQALLLGRGVALTRELGRELGVEPGDELPLVVQSRPVALQVAAWIEPRRLGSAWRRLLLVDVALAQELFDSPGRLDRVELVPRPGLEGRAADVAALAARARALLPADGGYRVAPASARREEGQRMVRALRFNLTALAGVSILVGIVLVATTLATSVVQRRAQIALLRSLGASHAQLTRALLVEAGVIGLFGGGLGVLLGWLGAQRAVSGVRASVATIVEGVTSGAVRPSLGLALVGLALGLASSVVAAVLPLREALRTPPVQGLRAEHPESVAERPWKARAALTTALLALALFFAALPPLEDRPIWALLSALALLSTLLVLAGPLVDLFASVGPRLGARRGIMLRLAQAALEAGRRRAAWAAAAVGVAVALAVAMTTMVGSFRRSVVDWTQGALPADLFVRPLATDSGTLVGRIDSRVVALARETLGTDAVAPFHESSASFRGQRVFLGGARFAVSEREGRLPFLDGRPPRTVFREALERGGAVVNEPFARRFGVARGDRIPLETPGGTVEREVVGVYRDYSGHIGRVVLDLDDFLRLYPDEGAQSVSIYVPQERVEASRAALAGALRGRFAVEILDNRELRGEVLRVFDRTFAVTVALQLISAVVAAIAVVTVLTALIHERRRELSVVRVLGGSRRQLFSLVIGEALLLGLAGTLGGLVIGLSVGWVLVRVVNLQSFGWTLEFVVPGSLFSSLLIVVPVCALAGALPALLALRASPRESLRAG